MKALSKTTGFVLSLVIGIAAATSQAAEPVHLALSPEQRVALGIEVGKPEVVETVPLGALPARVSLSNGADEIVTARLAGVLSEAHVATGESVAPGTVLAMIESPTYVELQRGLLEAITRFDLARSTAEREAALVAEGIVPGRRVLEAKAALERARLGVEEHAESLRLAGVTESGLERLRSRRTLASRLPVRCATSGPVLEQYARPGERLEAGAPIYRVADPRGLTLEIHTPVAVAAEIHAGTAVEVDGLRASAEVTSVGRSVDPQDQGVVVRARVTSGAAELLPGRFIRTRFLLPIERDANVRGWSVPNSALVRHGDRDWVFVEGPTGFRPLSVEVRSGTASRTLLAADLSADQKIAVRGTAALKAYWLEVAGGVE